MPRTRGTSLLIDDGGVLALIAAFLQEQGSIEHVWFSWTKGQSRSQRQVACQQHASLVDATWSQSDCPWPNTDKQTQGHDTLRTSRLLLAAGEAALAHSCDRVLWPVALGGDVAAMSLAVDRARLVEHTWQLDVPADRPLLLMDMPIVDLTMPQLADLATDLCVPQSSCWDCFENAPMPCGTCPGCQRVSAISAGSGDVISSLPSESAPV